MADTPMLKQYKEIKANYPDSILFFRLGDFYEMFGDDAIEASKILNITLTARNKGTPNEIPMCGVPHHAATNYIGKLTKSGKNVSICDQVSDPTLPGIVKREVVRTITPGTTLDDTVIDKKSNNFIAGIYNGKKSCGLAFVDLSTGSFKLTEFKSLEELISELGILSPTEILLLSDASDFEKYHTKLHEIAYTKPFTPEKFIQSTEYIQEHFSVKSLSSFGIENFESGIEATAKLLAYLQETQKESLDHITTLKIHNTSEYMLLDEATIRNLEIISPYFSKNKEAALLSTIDYTQTAMGGRLLYFWLLHPLQSIKDINMRLDAVAYLLNNSTLQGYILDSLKNMPDMERLIGRLGCRQANGRDMINLKTSLELIKELKEIGKDVDNTLLSKIFKEISSEEKAVELITNAIKEDAPTSITDGGFIADGYNQELDELRTISTSGKEWLNELQEKEISKTGISTLKVKFNKVFGYYIEVSKANIEKVPETYTRKQTLVNAERFITPELKEYEEKILTAEEKIEEIEYRIFHEVRDKLSMHFSSIQETAYEVAQLDILSGFTYLAKFKNYSQPVVDDSFDFTIINGRHPVIENIQDTEAYIPNDTNLNEKDTRLMLLTGPNMSGKSSYLRQNALIALLTHIGCFVPAEKAHMGLLDRIFTRVGASDNLAEGLSTFMVEMTETAHIVNNATSKSLIILDELGRGTSTYDGVSIAASIMEYIHKNIQAKTLFATHYHELIEIVEHMDGAANFSVTVKEQDDTVVFLRKILPQPINKSYGIQVAQLAGFSDEIINRAKKVLNDLEKEIHLTNGKNDSKQTTLFEKDSHPIIKELEDIDINSLTPIEALTLLQELKNKYKD